MDIEIRDLKMKDHSKAIAFAIKGMHLYWYVKRGPLLSIYGKAFFYKELLRASKAYGAYINGRFTGFILATFKGERKIFTCPLKKIYVKTVEILSNFIPDLKIREYEEANIALLEAFERKNSYDGEILFFATDQKNKIRGVGTALLKRLEEKEKGKKVFLYTDTGCNYHFYEHRGFKREGEINIMTGVKKTKKVKCFLYSKLIGKDI